MYPNIFIYEQCYIDEHKTVHNTAFPKSKTNSVWPVHFVPVKDMNDVPIHEDKTPKQRRLLMAFSR